MTREEQIQEILDAIERNEYEISYEAPQCITLEYDEQDNKYFKFSYDNCDNDKAEGCITINVAGHEYTCYLPFCWKGSDDLIEDKNLLEAICFIDEIDCILDDYEEDLENVVDFYRLVKGIKEKYRVQYPENFWDDEYDYIPDEIEEDDYDYDDFEYKDFEGKTYALHEDFCGLKEDGNGGFVAFAFDTSEKPDKTKGYQCVLLHLNQDYNIIEVKPSDKYYNPYNSPKISPSLIIAH